MPTLATSSPFVNRWGQSVYAWAADFTGDGKADIAAADGSNVYLYVSTGVDFELMCYSVPARWGDQS
jgi:hypothetical protein